MWWCNFFFTAGEKLSSWARTLSAIRAQIQGMQTTGSWLEHALMRLMAEQSRWQLLLQSMHSLILESMPSIPWNGNRSTIPTKRYMTFYNFSKFSWKGCEGGFGQLCSSACLHAGFIPAIICCRGVGQLSIAFWSSIFVNSWIYPDTSRKIHPLCSY